MKPRKRSDFSIYIEGLLTFRKSEVFSFSVALLYALVVSGYELVANISILLDVQSRFFGIVTRATILLLSILILFFGAKYRKLYLGVLWLPLAIFWLMYMARIAMDTVVVPVPLSRPGIEYYAYSIGSCLIPMMAFLVYPDINTIRRAFNAVLGFTAISVLWLLINVLVLNADAIYWDTMGRLGTTVLNPITIGHLAVTLIILCCSVFAGYVGSSWKKKYLVFILMMAGITTVILAASKGPILALVVVLLVMIWTASSGRYKSLGRLLVNGGLIALVIGVSVIFAISQNSSLIYRLSLFSAGDDKGVATRIELFSQAVEQFFKSPLFGHSLELEKVLSYPHNVVLESFMATGIIGGISFVILLLTSTWMALRIIRGRSQYSWLGLLFIQYVVGSLVSGSLAYSSSLWTFMGAVISISYISERRKTIFMD